MNISLTFAFRDPTSPCHNQLPQDCSALEMVRRTAETAELCVAAEQSLSSLQPEAKPLKGLKERHIPALEKKNEMEITSACSKSHRMLSAVVLNDTQNKAPKSGFEG